MSDETHLESFIEQIATLPHDVRRNLELLKDLDKTCSVVAEELRCVEQEYVRISEEKVCQLKVSKAEDGDYGVVVMGNDAEEQHKRVIPTTEELSAYVHDEDSWQHIVALRTKALQQAEEKVAISEQNFALVDETVRRLDKDLHQMESLLKTTGEFEAATGRAKPNDLAAIQVSPPSPDWILAKVISHDPETGMYKLSDEDVESNKSESRIDLPDFSHQHNAFVNIADRTFGILPTCVPSSLLLNHPCFLVFHLPESQVVVLGDVEKLSRGDIIYAVYPDTTSFYQATVVQAPRKVSGDSSFVMVNFVDDGDEHGVTHDKAVLLKHMMRIPYGATV